MPSGGKVTCGMGRSRLDGMTGMVITCISHDCCGRSHANHKTVIGDDMEGSWRSHAYHMTLMGVIVCHN